MTYWSPLPHDQLAYVQVTLDGTIIPMQLFSTVPPFGQNPGETYIGDISAFSGMTNVELRLTKRTRDPLYPSIGSFSLDAITFSTIVIPEPGTLAALSIAAAVALARNLRRRWRR